MGAMKELLMQMEEDVFSTDKDRWISKWGSHNLDVWDRLMSEETFEYDTSFLGSRDGSNTRS